MIDIQDFKKYLKLGFYIQPTYLTKVRQWTTRPSEIKGFSLSINALENEKDLGSQLELSSEESLYKKTIISKQSDRKMITTGYESQTSLGNINYYHISCCKDQMRST